MDFGEIEFEEAGAIPSIFRSVSVETEAKEEEPPTNAVGKLMVHAQSKHGHNDATLRMLHAAGSNVVKTVLVDEVKKPVTVLVASDKAYAQMVRKDKELAPLLQKALDDPKFGQQQAMLMTIPEYIDEDRLEFGRQSFDVAPYWPNTVHRFHPPRALYDANKKTSTYAGDPKMIDTINISENPDYDPDEDEESARYIETGFSSAKILDHFTDPENRVAVIHIDHPIMNTEKAKEPVVPADAE